MNYISTKTIVLSTFQKYPTVIFTPATAGLTAKVSKDTARRVCLELDMSQDIKKVKRGYYQLNTEKGLLVNTSRGKS